MRTRRPRPDPISLSLIDCGARRSYSLRVNSIQIIFHGLSSTVTRRASRQDIKAVIFRLKQDRNTDWIVQMVKLK